MQKIVIKSTMFILTFFWTCCFFTSLPSICSSSSLCSFPLEALLLLNESTTHHFCFVLFFLKEYSYDEGEKIEEEKKLSSPIH